MEERRKSIRISESLRVSYQVVKSFRMITSHSENISEGGISLPVLQPLQPKMLLDMEIYFDDSDESIKAIGEVIWLKPIKDLKFQFKVGVKFIKISPEDFKKLRSYLKAKTPSKHFGWIEENKD